MKQTAHEEMFYAHERGMSIGEISARTGLSVDQVRKIIDYQIEEELAAMDDTEIPDRHHDEINPW